jgi:Polyketide cyclase / dehydrase and lipid transport
MTRSLAVEQSRVIPVGVDEAFAGTLPLPLTRIFSHWYGPIGPIKEVRDQTGDWDAAGQTRVVMLTPGGSFHEELTSLDPPHSFGYALTGITGPLGLLVGRADGEWRFTVSGTVPSETTVTWRWNIHARSALTAPLLPALGAVWKGYARRSLETLSTLLTG